MGEVVVVAEVRMDGGGGGDDLKHASPHCTPLGGLGGCGVTDTVIGPVL